MKNKVDRFAVFAIGSMLALTLGACGGSQQGTPANASGSGQGETAEQQKTAEETATVNLSSGEALNALKNANGHVTDILVWDESTDINGNLGRPGQYVSKADFSDDRVKESWTTEEEKMKSGLSGGTMETFSSESDCDKRCKYLQAFMGADTGAFGLNQYMYKYPKAIFRVSYDVVPSEAEVYKGQMDEIMGAKSEAIVAKE